MNFKEVSQLDNKNDILSSELEAENNINSDTDTKTDEINTEENASEVFAEELADLAVDYQTDAALSGGNTAVAKKKRFIQLPIIISLAIVALVALVFFVFSAFFNTGIVGTWTIAKTATADEASNSDEVVSNYYTFDSDGTATISLGTMKMVGTYTLSNGDDGVRNIEINIPTALQGTFEYSVSGNIFTGRKMELRDTYYGMTYNFKADNFKTPDLKVDDNFKPSDKLEGKWTYNDGFNIISYEFNKDGTTTINQADILFVDGVYNYTDNKITIKYYASDLSTMELNYSFDGDKIVINGYAYAKDTGSSADEAK